MLIVLFGIFVIAASMAIWKTVSEMLTDENVGLIAGLIMILPRKKRVVMFLLTILPLPLFIFTAYSAGAKKQIEVQQSSPSSPGQIFPHCKGPGSGHGFGAEITYKVRRHDTHNDEPMVVISSEAKDEWYVEIWSSAPELLDIADGSKFQYGDNGIEVME